jgi:hypothetical protein
MEVSCQLHASASSPRYITPPLSRSLGGPKSRTGRIERSEKKILLAPSFKTNVAIVFCNFRFFIATSNEPLHVGKSIHT